MAKKNKKHVEDEQQNKSSADYYKLHTDAIDRLVNASADDSDEVEVGTDEKQRDPYKTGFLSHVPSWIKALLIKFWFNGAVCFFFYWGLGIYLTHTWDLILVIGVAMGIITDIIVNNIFRFIQSPDKEYDKWMLTPSKKFWTFFVNILYAGAVTLAVVYTYQGINLLINASQGNSPDTVALGVEPFLFGLLYLAYDLAVIWLKNLIVYLARKFSRKHNTASEEDSAQTEE